MTYTPTYLPNLCFETRNDYFANIAEAEAQAKIDIAQDLLDRTGNFFLPQAMRFESFIETDTFQVTGHISLPWPNERKISITHQIPHNLIPLPPRPWTRDAMAYWIWCDKYAACGHYEGEGRHEMLLQGVAIYASECLHGYTSKEELRTHMLRHWKENELRKAIEVLCCASDLNLLPIEEGSIPHELVAQATRAKLTGEWAH